MEQTIKAESHKQQVEMMKEQNKISEERILYLKDMERKLRQLVFEWRKAEEKENKDEVIKQMRNLLLNQKEKQVKEKAKKNFDSRYIEIGGAPKIGDKAMMKQNRQVGVVKEIRGKKAIVQLGIIPITVELNDLVVVKDKPDPRDEAA
jgi:DNA mismatch repair protein MutS2